MYLPQNKLSKDLKAAAKANPESHNLFVLKPGNKLLNELHRQVSPSPRVEPPKDIVHVKIKVVNSQNDVV